MVRSRARHVGEGADLPAPSSSTWRASSDPIPDAAGESFHETSSGASGDDTSASFDEENIMPEEPMPSPQSHYPQPYHKSTFATWKRSSIPPASTTPSLPPSSSIIQLISWVLALSLVVFRRYILRAMILISMSMILVISFRNVTSNLHLLETIQSNWVSPESMMGTTWNLWFNKTRKEEQEEEAIINANVFMLKTAPDTYRLQDRLPPPPPKQQPYSFGQSEKPLTVSVPKTTLDAPKLMLAQPLDGNAPNLHPAEQQAPPISPRDEEVEPIHQVMAPTDAPVLSPSSSSSSTKASATPKSSIQELDPNEMNLTSSLTQYDFRILLNTMTLTLDQLHDIADGLIERETSYFQMKDEAPVDSLTEEEIMEELEYIALCVLGIHKYQFPKLASNVEDASIPRDETKDNEKDKDSPIVSMESNSKNDAILNAMSDNANAHRDSTSNQKDSSNLEKDSDSKSGTETAQDKTEIDK